MAKKVILVADDVEMNRKVIRSFFKNEYEVLEAIDGAQALEMLEQYHVDILLLDIIMPNMDGFEVLEQLQKNERYQNLGILVATSTKEKTERKALSAGADDIVPKPYDPIIIRKRMENILAKKKLEKSKGETKEYDESFIEQLADELRTADKTVQLAEKNLDNRAVLEECLKNLHEHMEHLIEKSER